MVGFNGSCVCFTVLVLLQNVAFLWGVNVTLSIASLDNGFLGTQLKIHCDFYHGSEFFVPRRLEYFRIRFNQLEEEIVRETIEDNSTPQWTDTNLSQRSNLQRSSLTSATLTINRIECDDTAVYSCRFFVGNVSGDTYVLSPYKAFQVTAPPKVPTISYRPAIIVEKKPVEFTCYGNIGLPAGSLGIYLVRNGIESNLNAENGLVESVINSCTFERTATVRRIFTSSENRKVNVRCRVLQNYANRDIHFNETQKLNVLFSPRETKVFQSLDGGPRGEIGSSSMIKVPVSSRLSLTCESNSNPTALYVWSYLARGTNETKTESHTSTGVFYLNPIMMSHTGYYTCTVSNTIRNITYTDTVNITLNVSNNPPNDKESGGKGDSMYPSIPGIVGGIVGAIVAIVGIILAAIFVRRRWQNKDRANGPPNAEDKIGESVSPDDVRPRSTEAPNYEPLAGPTCQTESSYQSIVDFPVSQSANSNQVTSRSHESGQKQIIEAPNYENLEGPSRETKNVQLTMSDFSTPYTDYLNPTSQQNHASDQNYIYVS